MQDLFLFRDRSNIKSKYNTFIIFMKRLKVRNLTECEIANDKYH